MLKSVAGVGNLMGGMAIEWIAFPTQAAAGTVPADKVFWLDIAACPGLMIFYVTGFWFLSQYSISRGRYAEIRAALDDRQKTTTKDLAEINERPHLDPHLNRR
ncbi:MAG: hypothetical protein P8R42_17345 [Candidatus Binatia bacterium]|nr:hypothetical protein [Candidatus Binatia bacterium]